MDKKAYHRDYMRKWQKTKKGKESRRKSRLRSYATEKGREAFLARVRRYRSSVKGKTNERNTRRKRIQNDPSFRMRVYLNTRMYTGLKGKVKSQNTLSLIGCSMEDFWIYLESKFQTGMTRENYGKVWHVDHIMPCAIFDLSKPEHQKRCFHFSNLQPLFASENLSKGSKVTTNQFNLL